MHPNMQQVTRYLYQRDALKRLVAHKGSQPITAEELDAEIAAIRAEAQAGDDQSGAIETLSNRVAALEAKSLRRVAGE